MKKWTKILCCALFVGLCMVCGLAGCATVSDVKNSSSEVIFNGTSAVRVEDYLYFGNAVSTASNFTSDADYFAAADLSYLGRVDEKNLQARSGYHSPKDVENVSGEVVGYEKNFMFVLGQNIYYATPNRQMSQNENGAEHNFTHTCFFKSSLNGNGKSKLYTTDAEISRIEVLKFEDKYYIVLLAGGKLVTINLSNNKVSVLAEDVTSVALPKTYEAALTGSTLDWNGYIFYTKSREEGSANSSTNLVSRVAISGGESELVYGNGNVTFVGRERDVLFFTEALGSLQTVVYKADITGDNSKNALLNKRAEFVPTSSISDIQIIVTNSTTADQQVITNTLGYVYTQDSATKYITNSGRKGKLIFQNNGEALSGYKTLKVDGRTMFLSTTSGIYRANIAPAFSGQGGDVTVNVTELAALSDVYDGTLGGYDGEYVYFYAKLQTVPDDLKTDEEKQAEEDAAEDSTTEETADANYYLYRVSTTGGKFELLSKAESRITK